MYCNGLVTRHFVTTFETAISTHNKLIENVSLVFLFTYSFHSHEYCSLVLIINRPNTKTYCKTRGVLHNVKPTCYEVEVFSLIRWKDIFLTRTQIVGAGKDLFRRLTQTEARDEPVKAQN